jgi:class 3 adenylate cyclase
VAISFSPVLQHHRRRPPLESSTHRSTLADKILNARSALEGERRQVTVLFADLAGFTALAEGRDPEEVHTLMDRCFALIASEVHRFEGTINQYTGDGVMALFGAPIAHEDAPRRAAHAALAIQAAIRDLSRELAPKLERPLQMRIGLNTGPVVVGKIDDDLRMDYTAVGDTTNVAARLQQNARPGSVLVGASTHRLLAGYFETLDLGQLTVKAHAPVQAFEVLRARGRKARLDVESERGLTPLVGRDREIATLVEVFDRVQDGQGQIVFVAGEAGIGKSRLVLEFRRRLAAGGEPPTWLEGRCVSFGQSSPLRPSSTSFARIFVSTSSTGSRRSSRRSSRACATWVGSSRTFRSSGICSPSTPAIRPSQGWTALGAERASSRGWSRCRSVAPRDGPWCSSSRTCTGSIRAPRSISERSSTASPRRAFSSSPRIASATRRRSASEAFRRG